MTHSPMYAKIVVADARSGVACRLFFPYRQVAKCFLFLSSPRFCKAHPGETSRRSRIASLRRLCEPRHAPNSHRVFLLPLHLAILSSTSQRNVGKFTYRVCLSTLQAEARQIMWCNVVEMWGTRPALTLMSFKPGNKV
jgi:hypothetical protein